MSKVNSNISLLTLNFGHLAVNCLSILEVLLQWKRFNMSWEIKKRPEPLEIVFIIRIRVMVGPIVYSWIHTRKGLN